MVEEENESIRQITRTLLNSQEFNRMPVQSRAGVLSGQIIRIRDEYRRIQELMKKQQLIENEEVIIK